MTIRRELYRRGLEFVAVRQIQLTSAEFLQPGQLIDKSKFKTHQIKRWYNMRRIGVVDSEWTNAMLNDDRAHARPEVTGQVTDHQTELKVKRGRKPQSEKTAAIPRDIVQLASQSEPVASEPVALKPTLNLKLPGDA